MQNHVDVTLAGSTIRSRPEAGGKQADSLGPEVMRWLDKLPEAVRPMRTCGHFPRVINGIVAVWSNANECKAFFETLLMDERGNRHGFQPDIAFELATLKNYVETVVYPTTQTVWDEIVQRSHDR